MTDTTYPPPPETDLTYVLVLDDICPRCLGELDTSWDCNECGFDARCFVEDIQ